MTLMISINNNKYNGDYTFADNAFDDNAFDDNAFDDKRNIIPTTCTNNN